MRRRESAWLDHGTDGAAGQVGQGPVNRGDNVAGMGSHSAAPSETPAVDENAFPQQDDQQPQQQQQPPRSRQPRPAQAVAVSGARGWPPAAGARVPALPDLPDYPPNDPQQRVPAVVSADEQAIVAHFQALLGQASSRGSSRRSTASTASRSASTGPPSASSRPS